MIKLQLRDVNPLEVIKMVAKQHPEIYDVLEQAEAGASDQMIQPYQAAVLYMLTRQYPKGRIVELGTQAGYSAQVISHATEPDAKFTSVDNSAAMLERARKHLLFVELVQSESWDYAAHEADGSVDFVFVDADHEQVIRDLVWWHKIRPGGLVLFHDYSARFPRVIEAVHILKAEPDIVVIGMDGEGMAGVYRP